MIKDIVEVKIGYVILKSVIGLLQKVQKKSVILALFGAKIIRLPSCSRGAAARAPIEGFRVTSYRSNFASHGSSGSNMAAEA